MLRDMPDTRTMAEAEHLLETPPLLRMPHLLGEPRANDMLARLEHGLDWQRPHLRLYGREHPIPRQQVWMGDTGYRYSGQDFVPDPWHPMVVEIRDEVIDRLSRENIRARFNSVLLNRYADGQERMGWHSDDEPELGVDPLIAAVSLGCERPLRFRWRDARQPPFNVWLPHDSLLLMGPGVQRHLQHALLPRKLPGQRISLTFRWVHA